MGHLLETDFCFLWKSLLALKWEFLNPRKLLTTLEAAQ